MKGAFSQYGGATTVSGTLASAIVGDYGGAMAYKSALTSGSTTTSLRLQGGVTLEFDAAVSSSQTVLFQDATDILNLGTPSSFGGTIAGLANGDAIDLLNQTATSLSFSAGVLTVMNGGSQVAALHMSGAYTSASFTLAVDNHGGSMILA